MVKYTEISDLSIVLYKPHRLKHIFFIHLLSFKTPPSGAVMSDEDFAQLKADCAFSMRKGVKNIEEVRAESCTRYNLYFL